MHNAFRRAITGATSVQQTIHVTRLVVYGSAVSRRVILDVVVIQVNPLPWTVTVVSGGSMLSFV